jgi:hypothetical protein
MEINRLCSSFEYFSSGFRRSARTLSLLWKIIDFEDFCPKFSLFIKVGIPMFSKIV